MNTSEFDYIAWLRSQTPMNSHVQVGPGDDTAVLAPPANPLLITTDMLMDGTDFHIAEVGFRSAGRKAMAVNLSDIAAMAGSPLAAVVSVAMPREGGRKAAEQLYFGLRETADEFGVALCGGDTNSWVGAVVISVTVLGDATDKGPVLRSGARPGDWIFVTGPLGGSILGRHLTFTPRVREALQLHRAVDLHAMIDISDGLTADLNHICTESTCGALLIAEAIPIAPAAHELARSTGQPALQHALSDGEDFELAFAVSPQDGAKLLREQPVAGINLIKIGECVANGFWLEQDGTRHPLEPMGYTHSLE